MMYSSETSAPILQLVVVEFASGMDVLELHGTIDLEHDLFDTVLDPTRLCSRQSLL